MRRSRSPIHCVLALTMLLSACQSKVASTPKPDAAHSAHKTPAAVRIAFEIPRGGAPIDLFRTPWPTEMARLADGRIDMRGYVGYGSALIEEYLRLAAEDLDGFSIAPVVYFRFEDPVALSGLPQKSTSRSPHDKVVLVDVDPKSPERGTFYPLAFFGVTRDLHYLKAGTLAVRPLDGFVLRPDTLYAAAVRRSFGDVPGGLVTARDMDAILATTPRADKAEERARKQHAPALDELARLGVERADIAALAVFRTASPTRFTDGLVGAVDALFAARGAEPDGPNAPPRALTADWDDTRSIRGLYRVIRGAYCTPSIQQKLENAPFLEHEGGRVLWSADGRPKFAQVAPTSKIANPDCPGQIRARFFLSVPDRPAPKDGFPLLVTAHGTGGDATSFLGANDLAGWAALEGLAAISTDQPLHGGSEGGRPGSSGPLILPMGIPILSGGASPGAAFYNPLYPGATRGNLHQAAIDAAVLVRLFGGLDTKTLRTEKGLPLRAPNSSYSMPKLDPTRTALAGHSQGCQSLAVLGAVDPLTRGVLLSGCGGDARLGILYGRPVEAPISELVAAALGLDPDELTPFHPLFALVQSLAEPIDPLAFGRRYWSRSPGRQEKIVLHIEGLRDKYTPEVASEALAVALRAQPVTSLLRPVEGLHLLGFVPQPNRVPESPTGRFFAQYMPSPGRDGHFVLYQVPAANHLFRQVLRTLSR